MNKCECSLRTKLVGEGCDKCKPELALGHARDYISDLEKENKQLEEINANLVNALETITSMFPEYMSNYGSCRIGFTKDAISKIVNARKALTKAKEQK